MKALDTVARDVGCGDAGWFVGQGGVGFGHKKGERVPAYCENAT